MPYGRETPDSGTAIKYSHSPPAVKEGWRPTEEEVKRVVGELLDTIVFLGGLRPPVVHRDIKPANIVIEGGTEVRPGTPLHVLYSSRVVLWMVVWSEVDSVDGHISNHNPSPSECIASQGSSNVRWRWPRLRPLEPC